MKTNNLDKSANNKPLRTEKKMFTFQIDSQHLIALNQFSKDRFTSAAAVVRQLIAAHMTNEGYLIAAE